jgi:hypothetical protein
VSLKRQGIFDNIVKSYWFIIALVVGMSLIWSTAMVAVPDTGMPKNEVIYWLKVDRDIHVSYLEKPDNLITGNYAWHRMWVDRFDQIINYINGDSTPLSGAEAIQLINLAQSTHAGIATTNYYEAKHHYDWWQRYEKIKEFLKRR